MRAARTATALLCTVALAAGAAGCGGSEVDYQEVPGPPADVAIPSDSSSLGDLERERRRDADADADRHGRARRHHRPGATSRGSHRATAPSTGTGHRHHGHDRHHRHRQRRRERPRGGGLGRERHGASGRLRRAAVRGLLRAEPRRLLTTRRGPQRGRLAASSAVIRAADTRGEPSVEGGSAVPDSIPAPPTSAPRRDRRPGRGRGVPAASSRGRRPRRATPTASASALTNALHDALAVDQVLIFEVAQGAAAGDAHVMRSEGGEDDGYVQALTTAARPGTARVVRTGAPLHVADARGSSELRGDLVERFDGGVRAVRARQLGRRGAPRGDLDLPRAARAARRRARAGRRARRPGRGRPRPAGGRGARRALAPARTRRSCGPRAR